MAADYRGREPATAAATMVLPPCCFVLREYWGAGRIRTDLKMRARGHTFPPPRSHIFYFAAGASPSPATLLRNNRANMLDWDLKNINSHNKSHHIYLRDPPIVDCYTPPLLQSEEVSSNHCFSPRRFLQFHCTCLMSSGKEERW